MHPTQGSSCLSLSPVNESLAVTAGHDRHLVLFDMLTTSELASVETPETFESVAFLPDGHRLLAGGTSGRLYLYDLRNTRQMPPSTFDAHSRPLLSIATMQSQETEMQRKSLEMSLHLGGFASGNTSCPGPYQTPTNTAEGSTGK